MKSVALNGTPRTEVGKKATKTLRASGNVPCIIYGGKENITFYSTPLALRDIVYTPDFKTAEITVSGKTYTCILKDIQLHPTKDSVEHIDFLQLVDGKTIKTTIPLRFTGNSEGQKAGGKFVSKMKTLKVKTTPAKMVDEIILDITKLKLGEVARVRDLNIPEGIEILTPPATPIAAIEIPRAMRTGKD